MRALFSNESRFNSRRRRCKALHFVLLSLSSEPLPCRRSRQIGYQVGAASQQAPRGPSSSPTKANGSREEVISKQNSGSIAPSQARRMVGASERRYMVFEGDPDIGNEVNVSACAGPRTPPSCARSVATAWLQTRKVEDHYRRNILSRRCYLERGGQRAHSRLSLGRRRNR